jgi:hypothetical protein
MTPDELKETVEYYDNFGKAARLGAPVIEHDPGGLKPSDPGAKLDAGKTMAGVLADFPRALKSVAEVGTFGAKKYSRGGWQSVPRGVERYTDAMWRHLLEDGIHPMDADSSLLHLSHACWNCLAVLELKLREENRKGER